VNFSAPAWELAKRERESKEGQGGRKRGKQREGREREGQKGEREENKVPDRAREKERGRKRERGREKDRGRGGSDKLCVCFCFSDFALSAVIYLYEM